MGWAVLGLVLVSSAPSAEASVSGPYRWRDVKPGSRAWFAKGAINDVAGAHDWMRDFGLHAFHPNDSETRGLLARAVVRAFAPTQAADPSVHFKDISPGGPFSLATNVAVSNGWMTASTGTFDPTAPVDEFTVSRAIVLALGLAGDVRGANHIHTTHGHLLRHSGRFGVFLIGRVLGLWRNHDPDVRGDSEAFDILPTSEVPRSDVAYALHRAADLGDSAYWYADQYADVDVGTPSPAMKKVIEFGMRYVGYPYVYAGEWATPSWSGYCCGTQLQGGFDCSGLTWWLMRAGDSVWNNTSIRGYRGWSLPQRSSSQMAAAIPKKQRVAYKRLQPGDLMLYGSGPSPASIYHVDNYIGNGWALDSGGNGVTIVNVSGGWYRDVFQYGRRILSAS